MFTKIDRTSLEVRSSSNAFLTASAVAPPPTSSCELADERQRVVGVRRQGYGVKYEYRRKEVGGCEGGGRTKDNIRS